MRHFLNRPSLPDRIRQLALEQPAKIALRNELNEEINYKKLYESACGVAEGLRRGDASKFVGILCRDPIQMSIGIFATWLSGRVAVPLHYSYPSEEIKHRLNVSGSKFILTDASYASAEGLATNLRLKSFNPSWSNEFDVTDGDEDALVLFTSGTTGKPKGVVHSFNTLNYQLNDLHSAWEINKSDEFFFALPLNHIHGLVTGLLNGLSAGASLTAHSHFDSNLAWERLINPKTTFFTAVPTIYSKLLNTTAKGDLNHLRLMISGSSPLSEPLLQNWIDKFRKKGIVERYGMTETGMIASNSISGEIKPGCVGKALGSVEIKIPLEEGNNFGGIEVKGPGLFKGYLTASGEFKAHNPSNFFNTGDQGLFDFEGNLRLVGRDRDILKVSGYKVGCGEIESVINNHSGVKECAVMGLVDPKDSSNQMISVLVVSDDKEIVRELRKFLSTRLAHYKIPRKWIVQTEPLPRNLLGKPDYKEINKKLVA